MAKNTCGYLWRLQQLDIRDNKYVICVINKLRKNTNLLRRKKQHQNVGYGTRTLNSANFMFMLHCVSLRAWKITLFRSSKIMPTKICKYVCNKKSIISTTIVSRRKEYSSNTLIVDLFSICEGCWKIFPSCWPELSFPLPWKVWCTHRNYYHSTYSHLHTNIKQFWWQDNILITTIIKTHRDLETLAS